MEILLFTALSFFYGFKSKDQEKFFSVPPMCITGGICNFHISLLAQKLIL